MQQPIKKTSLMKAEVEIKKDNTSIKKVLPEVEKVEYEYMGRDEKLKSPATSKDSADYRSGYRAGRKEVSRSDKSPFGEKYKKGLTWTGLNPRFNEGFSEGKDKSLSLKAMKKR